MAGESGFGGDFGARGAEQGLVGHSATNTSAGRPQGFARESAQSATNQAIADAVNNAVQSNQPDAFTFAGDQIAAILNASNVAQNQGTFMGLQSAVSGLRGAEDAAAARSSDAAKGAGQTGFMGGQRGSVSTGTSSSNAASTSEMEGFGTQGAGAGGGKVICTDLYDKGYISYRLYAANAIYYAYVSRRITTGYHFWGKPFVNWMQGKPWVYKLIRPIVVARSQELAHIINSDLPSNIFGKLINTVLNSVNWCIGGILTTRRYHAPTT